VAQSKAVHLVQRQTELSALHRALDRAAAGQGNVIIISGPMGIGKTSLLQAAVGAARTRGMTVCTARGARLEKDFPYAVVRRLFEHLDLASDMVAGAAVTGLPAITGQNLSTGDSFAVVHGLYWLTANLTVGSPVLLAVDDCHWCDEPSLRFLGYLAARLDGLPAVVVATVRTGEPATEPRLLADLMAPAELITPADLDRDAAAGLVRGTVGAGATDAFCATCHRVTGGNPLLLTHLTQAFVESGADPGDGATATLVSLAAAGVDRTLRHRYTLLPEGAPAVARALAVLGAGAPMRHLAALAERDFDEVAQIVEALRAAGILATVGPLDFAHPVLRAATEETMSEWQVAQGHERAAQLLADEGGDIERQAMHLLHAPQRGRAATAATLASAARSAVDRGAPESAVGYLRRALAEPAPTEQRGQIQFLLGMAMLATQRHADAPKLLRDAVAGMPPAQRPPAVLQAVRRLGVAGYFDDAATFTDALIDPERADATDRMIEAEIQVGSWLSASRVPFATDRVERWRAHGLPDDLGGKLLKISLAHYLAGRAGPAAESIELLRQAMVDNEVLLIESLAVVFLAMDLAMTGQLDEAERVCSALIDHGQRVGSPSIVASFAFPRAFTRLWRGALSQAEADARWSFDLKQSLGPAHVYAWPLACLLDALVERGRLDEADAVVDEAWFAGSSIPGDVAAAKPEVMGWAVALESRGRLRLAQGLVESAATDLADAGARFERLGNAAPGLTRWRADAAVAAYRLGRKQEALSLATEYAELAASTGIARLQSIANRTLAAVSPPDRREPLLSIAVDEATAAGAPLELAHALAELGSHARRHGRATQARDLLRRALDAAHQVGADPLVARAHHELVAAGGRPRRHALSGQESLTNAERRVAELVAQGLSNRDTAQRLFITQRTVETHLGNVYAKLSISRRDQLTRYSW
jgi:DNA-binding CsgD family transcriptional regulator